MKWIKYIIELVCCRYAWCYHKNNLLIKPTNYKGISTQISYRLWGVFLMWSIPLAYFISNVISLVVYKTIDVEFSVILCIILMLTINEQIVRYYKRAIKYKRIVLNKIYMTNKYGRFWFIIYAFISLIFILMFITLLYCVHGQI